LSNSGPCWDAPRKHKVHRHEMCVMQCNSLSVTASYQIQLGGALICLASCQVASSIDESAPATKAVKWLDSAIARSAQIEMAHAANTKSGHAS
jgi:hypothetical protein